MLQHRRRQPARIECVPHHAPLPSESIVYYIYFLANVLHCAIFLQESTRNERERGEGHLSEAQEVKQLIIFLRSILN